MTVSSFESALTENKNCIRTYFTNLNNNIYGYIYMTITHHTNIEYMNIVTRFFFFLKKFKLKINSKEN